MGQDSSVLDQGSGVSGQTGHSISPVESGVWESGVALRTESGVSWGKCPAIPHHPQHEPVHASSMCLLSGQRREGFPGVNPGYFPSRPR